MWWNKQRYPEGFSDWWVWNKDTVKLWLIIAAIALFLYSIAGTRTPHYCEYDCGNPWTEDTQEYKS